MNLFEQEESKYPPLMVKSHNSEPKKMEYEEYQPLLEKHWDIEQAFTCLKATKQPIYTPRNQFELCE